MFVRAMGVAAQYRANSTRPKTAPNAAGVTSWRYERAQPGPSPTRPTRRVSYSARSAFIGEIAAARPAGMTAATSAHVPSEPAAIASASGSQNGTP